MFIKYYIGNKRGGFYNTSFIFYIIESYYSPNQRNWDRVLNPIPNACKNEQKRLINLSLEKMYCVEYFERIFV